MDRNEALRVVSESIGRGTSSPFVGVPDRDAAVNEAAARLKSKVIDPYQVSVTSASYAEYEFEKFASGQVYAIAGNAEHLLLYNQNLGLFALGWGNDSNSITMLGFATDDVLYEWRG